MRFEAFYLPEPAMIWESLEMRAANTEVLISSAASGILHAQLDEATVPG